MKQLIKDISLDLLSLYRNLGHWIISKLIIFFVDKLLILLVLLPFILIGVIIYFLNSHFILSLFVPVLYIFELLGSNKVLYTALLLFLSLFSYSSVLLFKLNLKYINGKKLKYKFKNYFNFVLIKRYFSLLFLIILLLLVPVVIFFIGLFILVITYGGLDKVTVFLQESASMLNSFSITMFILLLLSILLFLYFIYKSMFSYILLIDEYKDKNEQKSSYYIKKSWKLFSGFKNHISFIFSLLLLFVALFPVSYLDSIISNKIGSLQNYIDYKNGKIDIKGAEDTYYAQALELEYGKETIEENKSDLSLYIKFQFLFWIFKFLFIWGLINMMIVSFYKHKLKGN